MRCCTRGPYSDGTVPATCVSECCRCGWLVFGMLMLLGVLGVPGNVTILLHLLPDGPQPPTHSFLCVEFEGGRVARPSLRPLQRQG